MKKQNNSLTIKLNRTRTEETCKDKLLLLIPGSILLIGFMGMLTREWQLGLQGYLMLIPALVALFLGLLLCWEQKWQAVSAIGVLMALVAICAIFHRILAKSIAALMEQIADWWLRRTGSYTLPYEDMGSLLPALLLGALCCGLGTAWILRRRSSAWQSLITIMILAAWMLGVLESGWPLGIYLLGTLLVLAQNASGLGKTVVYSGGIALAVLIGLMGILWIIGFTPSQTNLGSQLANKIHSLYWESAKNPLPEGKLTEFGAYRPRDEEALEVTMQSWTPLYLRGYVAGDYTEEGWEALDSEEILLKADELFDLQEQYFFPSNQIAAGWQSMEAESENAVAINVLGACRANAYLPYGASDITENVLTSTELLREGMKAPKETSYVMELYPVEDSYILQGELTELEDNSYRSAESIYRDWVYENYVTVPEDDYEVLTKYFMVDGKITTVQAKQKIHELLEQMITYEEKTVTDIGERNFPSYVLEVSRQGYSVHYATLATLLMRCCGIPARYVEGYVVTPSQADALADGDTLVLTQRNSHAWTEYYLDGVGWIPFDATPGYSDILEYELPTEGTPTEDFGGTINTQYVSKKQQKLPEKDTKVEEEKLRQRQQLYIRQAIIMALILLGLAIILLILRTVFLRHQLCKRQEVFYSNDYRKACAGILSYMMELLTALGMQGDNLNATEKAEQTAAILKKEVEAKEVETMLNEVWFSNHNITSDQQEKAMLWLEEAKQTWKQEVSAVKRFKQRFITCKIR